MKRFIPFLLILLAGCSAAERSRNGPGRLMSNYTVTLYSGGHPVTHLEHQGPGRVRDTPPTVTTSSTP